MNNVEINDYGISAGFTLNQKEAAFRDGNIVVSAGAGSGKTTVMIARIINKIISGEKLEHMLIVTFTRSAAADMRIKLSKKLAEVKLESRKVGDIEVASRVSDAIEAMSVCNIGTLHGYCQKLIKRYYGVAEIDPAATVCEDGEIELIKRAAIEDAIFDRLTAEQDEEKFGSGVKYFTDMYDLLTSRKNGDGAVETIKTIIDFALSMPDPDGYLSCADSDKAHFPELDKICDSKYNALSDRIVELKKDLIAAGMTKHSEVIDEFSDYANGIIDAPTKTSHVKKLDVTDVLNDRFLKLKSDCKAYRDYTVECAELKQRESKPYTDALLDVARVAAENFGAAKKRQGKLDYSDLEHGAFEVLNDGKCMAEIIRSVKYVFIDEFQDVNPLQYAFMRAFKSCGAEMFVVGDIKQSIYGFRRCSPDHFKNEIENAINVDEVKSGKTCDGERFIHIPLTDNFRSSCEAVDFINRIFDKCMTDEFGGADYRGSDRLVCGRKSEQRRIPTGARAELVILPAEKNVRDCSVVYSVTNAAQAETSPDPEAEFIACAVEEYIGFCNKRTLALAEANSAENRLGGKGERRMPDNKNVAPPELGNIAVLMRTANAGFCADLAREFGKRGIRYNFGRKSSVKSYASAVALIDIIRYIDNRFDDVALFTALRSPMGGFSDSELAEISNIGGAFAYKRAIENNANGKRQRVEFWQRVDAYSGVYNDRLYKFFELRDEIICFSKKHDCGDTLGFITSKIDYFQHVYETGGDARAVEALIEYAAERRCDVHGFLAYYDSADFDLELDGGSDAVNITTVHSSKGLEYDFVIVADTAREFNKRDLRKKVLISENGVAVKIPDTESRTAHNTAPYEVEKSSAPDKLKQEELRLFYVALTRAKEKLIVCAKQKPNDKTVDQAENAKRPLDFALLGATPVTAENALGNIKSDTAECEKYIRSYSAVADAGIAAVEIPEIVRAVSDRCSKQYKNENIPIKASVTSIAHELNDGNEESSVEVVLTSDDRAYDYRKKSNTDGKTDVRLRGTAYHRAMELIDFDSPDYTGLENKCENFELVDVKKIERAVDVMKRITEGKRCFKERYFIVDMPRIYVDGGDGNVLVQGIIDLMIADGESVTIVDYKTGDPKSLSNDGYMTQLKLYAHAVDISTGGKLKVKKAFLYAFESGELIPVALE